METRYGYQYTLKQNLEALSLHDLKMLANHNNIPNYEKLTEYEIRAMLIEVFKRMDYLIDHLIALDEDEIKKLRRIIYKVHKEDIKNIFPLFRFGLIFESVNDDTDYEVSKDLLNVVEELLKSPDFIEANIEFNKVNDTVKAYINLNGYFELSFFLLEVFKEINHTRLQDYLFKVIEKNDYKKFSKYYYSPVIADDDIFQTLLDATQEQDIYLLTNLEILAYKDFTFFPQHKHNTNLYDFLTKNNYLYKELAEKFLKDVQIMIRFGNASLDDIYIKLNEYDIEFRSEGDAEEFFELYFTLLNNTRMWVLRGHTPIETSGFNIQTGKFES